MREKFEVVFLKQAIEFIENLDLKAKIKILYNIDKARWINDPKLFKKLDGEIWEFRTKYEGFQSNDSSWLAARFPNKLP